MPVNSYPNLLLIVNPVAGNGKAMKYFKEDRQKLSIIYPDLPIYITKAPGDFGGIQLMIQKIKPDLLIVYGGDGTLNDVINGSDANLPIAIVPVGSGNDFATLLGIYEEQDIMSRLVRSDIAIADMGRCNGHWFVNGLGIGFDGEIARQTVSNTSLLPSFMKYYIAIFRSILFYKESAYTITWKNEEHAEESIEQKCLMISVANGIRYGGSFKVSPKSEHSDGLLDLVVIGKVHPLLRPVYLPLVVVGKHLKLRFVRHHKAQYVKITTDKVAPAHTDGELLLAREFEVTVHPGKMQFIL